MKKKIFLTSIGLLIIAVFYLFIKFNGVNDVKENCLTDAFDKVFKKENSIQLGKTYDFSEIFNCKEWDDLIVVGGQRANRTAIFLKEGIALPSIDYFNRAQGSLVFFFIKDKKLVSSPISFYHPDFLYFENFNDFDYVSIKKQDAVFRCVKLDATGSDEEILTFETVR